MDRTSHKIFISSSQNMRYVPNESVDLIVTSPPYPMIEMWDGLFGSINPWITKGMDYSPVESFSMMHRELGLVWRECFRVLRPGGIMCVNIGDATRSVGGTFQMFDNHSMVVSACVELGFVCLPCIIWRKQTNAPNKFMGSGMLPSGAYVTLEHEWILIFRKGDKRCFRSDDEKANRRKSAFFWEERNRWFSDVWDIKGVKQKLDGADCRKRNASFPLEIPYRLVNMFSVFGDTVLDPFLGLGTTTIACMLSKRNSVGVEISSELFPNIKENIGGFGVDRMNGLVRKRIEEHLNFISEREKAGKPVKNYNQFLNCKVVTSQETDIDFSHLKDISVGKGSDLTFVCRYDSLAGISIPFEVRKCQLILNREPGQ